MAAFALVASYENTEHSRWGTCSPSREALVSDDELGAESSWNDADWEEYRRLSWISRRLTDVVALIPSLGRLIAPLIDRYGERRQRKITKGPDASVAGNNGSLAATRWPEQSLKNAKDMGKQFGMTAIRQDTIFGRIATWFAGRQAQRRVKLKEREDDRIRRIIRKEAAMIKRTTERKQRHARK